MIVREINSGPLKVHRRPARNPQYRKFIREFPCCACGQSWHIDCAHTGPHGIATKSSDFNCIPLCRKCHQKFDAAPLDFAERRRIDVPILIEMFQYFWSLRHPEVKLEAA